MPTLLRGIVALSVVATIGCATMDTGSFVDRNVSFGKYRSYNWTTSARTDGDARLEKNAFFKDHLEGEVEKQLASKGFEGPSARRPDLLVRYHAAVTSRVEVINGEPTGYGYCSFDCVNRVNEYETATLVIDVVDARTKKIVWRGWARNDLNDVLDDQDRMERRIREAVSEMMAKLPARS